jgi:hypothetical protein
MTLQLELRLVVGFAVILSLAAVINKAGDMLYHKGIAKPFYLFGYRLHHKNFLLAIVPSTYVVVATLVLFHYMRILWSSFWPSVEFTLFIAGACLAVDLTLDALSSMEKRRALLHHEWLYVLVPAYAFTHLLALV